MAAPWAVCPCNSRDALEDQSTLLGCLGQPSSSGCPQFPTAPASRFSGKGEAGMAEGEGMGEGMAEGGACEDGAICFY